MISLIGNGLLKTVLIGAAGSLIAVGASLLIINSIPKLKAFVTSLVKKKQAKKNLDILGAIIRENADNTVTVETFFEDEDELTTIVHTQTDIVDNVKIGDTIQRDTYIVFD